MLNHTVTPRMTRHALERCQEMGIPARLAKGIYRRPAIVRTATRKGEPSRWPRFLIVSDVFPDYAIIVDDRPDGPWVVTVVFRTHEAYTRNGSTYTPKKGK